MRYSTRPIKSLYAKVVREGDEFSEEIVNGEPSVTFKPKAFNNGKIVGAFAVCLYKDGGMVYEVMSLQELEQCRKSSKAKNSPAWQKFTGEMYKKTVLHRLCKHIELEFDNPEQTTLFREDVEIETDTQKLVENEIEVFGNSEDFIDVEE
jgi:recombination protein RecT